MTIQATRATLLGTLVRSSDPRRIARVLGRMSHKDLSLLLLELPPLGLRRIARVLLDDDHRAASLERIASDALVRLLAHAPDDLTRASLEAMPPREAARFLRALPYVRRHALLTGMEASVAARITSQLPRAARPRRVGDDSLGAVLRLRRLFA